MLQTLLFVLLVAIMLFAAFLVGKYTSKNGASLEKINRAKENNKKEAKNKILMLLKKRNKINNADVKKLLSVSDATATNYLEELEKEGKITQHGETGRGVFYTHING